MQRSRLPVLLTAALALGLAPGLAAAATTGIYRGVLPVVKFDVSPPLRELAKLGGVPSSGRNLLADPGDVPEGEPGLQDVDPLAQTWLGPTLEIPGPLVSFSGPSNISGVQPPDTDGDVGPNHYVSMTNLSYAVYSKTGTLLAGPAFNNTLWAGFGGDCQTDNSGDPVVLYDETSDRWMLSQFTASGPTYFNCVALSTSSDPTGTYFRWAFSTGANFPDYPKYGFWPDGLYISTREFAGAPFAGVGAYAVERADLVSGNPTPTVISFLVPPGGTPYNVGDGLLPSDWDGPTAPPGGSPNYYIGSMDNGGPYGAPQDALTVWEFHADFGTPGNSTFGLVTTIPIASYDTVFGPCGGTRACIPQPGTANRIDILSYRQRPMHRAAYRNFGSHESIVTNQSVEGVTNIAGMRWWEIRNLSTTATLFQEGTYVPGSTDSIHRWMGSIAQDGSGNMALGYSVSDATATFPGVRYTGRLSTDPVGTMPQGEGTIVVGTGSQTSGNRWGDYSAMNIDPVDDCTFWYTQEWFAVNGGNWQTRIGSFKFNECGSPDFTLGATPPSQTICAGDNAVYDIAVGSVSGFNNPVTLSASGHPGGTTTSFVPNPVTPLPGTSTFTVGNTGGASAGVYSIDVSGAASGSGGHSTAVELVVNVGNPGAAMLTSPANGATNVPVTPVFTWVAGSGAADYLIEVDDNNDFSSPEYSETVVLTTATPASPLASSTEYFWRVTANNGCGSTVSAVFSFTTAAQPGDCAGGTVPNALYEYGFEAGANGWTSSGTGNTWAQSAVRVHSGSFSWKANDPATVSDQRLVSPPVVLPVGEGPLTLQFWNHQTIEANGAAACYDGGILEVSTNGGTTWTQVPSVDLLTDPYDGPVSTCCSNPLQNLQAWCGDPQDWTNSIADIDAYAGQTVNFRFRLGSDSSVSREGWYLDDVKVQSCVSDTMPFIGDFETGDTSQWSAAFP